MAYARIQILREQINFYIQCQNLLNLYENNYTATIFCPFHSMVPSSSCRTVNGIYVLHNLHCVWRYNNSGTLQTILVGKTDYF